MGDAVNGNRNVSVKHGIISNESTSIVIIMLYYVINVFRDLLILCSVLSTCYNHFIPIVGVGKRGAY